MNGKRLLILNTTLLLLLTAPGCRLFRKSKQAPPPAPPPAAQPAPQQTQPPKSEEIDIPAPPEISPQNPDLTQRPPSAAPGKLPPPPRPRSRQTPRREPQETAQQPPAAEQAPSAIPQLEQILSPEQRQAYNDEIERNVGRAQKTVDILQGRRLNRDQKTYLARIRVFIEQAIEARKTDLFRAKNLSERASVLAEDLLRSTQ